MFKKKRGLKFKQTFNGCNKWKLLLTTSTTKEGGSIYRFQLEEFCFIIGGKKLLGTSYYTNYVATGINTYAGQGVAELFDGNTGTKICGYYATGGMDIEITFDTTSKLIPEQVGFMTAEDTRSYPHRNLQGWKLYGKVNGSYKLVSQSSTKLPDTNLTWYTFDVTDMPAGETKLICPSYSKTTTLPSDSLFFYAAKNYDSTNKKIPNMIVSDKAWGDLLDHGTLTFNYWTEGGVNYLSGTSNTNYLYRTLSDTELNQIKANTAGACFSYIIRASRGGSTSSFGGLLSTRNYPSAGDGHYRYMFKTKLVSGVDYVILNYYGTDGSSKNDIKSIPFYDNEVYELVVKPTSMTVKNLSRGTQASYATSTSRDMTTDFRIMNAGYSGENGVNVFFACYGIDRELTSDEEELIKDFVISQDTSKTEYSIRSEQVEVIPEHTEQGIVVPATYATVPRLVYAKA